MMFGNALHQIEGSAVSIIKKAVDKAGGAGAVARELNISRISVYEWISKNRLPEKKQRALALAQLTGWAYTPHMLAPDLYPNPSDGLPSPLLG
jgi:DNA-binding transcriptional regulator YdaS (Cro superfamily)